jgi:hypothetical protein
MRKKPHEKGPRPRGRKSRLEELIGRVLAGTEGEEEAQAAFHEALEEHVKLPFRTDLPDGPATVRAFEVGAEDLLVAVCLRGAERREVPLDELPLPKPGPKGTEWILAYRAWRDEES